MAEDKGKFQLEVNTLNGVGLNNYRANIEDLKRKAEFGNRQKDTTIVNSDGANASMRLSDNKATLASSANNNIKINQQQQISHSFEEKHTTNRFNLETYDILVNGHKLNPNLWEYADMKQFQDAYGGKYAVGGFCMFGTVLTPSWDSQLHRYVLIRRLARMPLFSQAVNVPEILAALNIEDPTKVAYKYNYKQHTESVESFYNRVAGQVAKDADENANGAASGSGSSESGSSGASSGGGDDSAQQGGEASEVAPNGRHYLENDIKYLMDQGMSRQQAIDILAQDEKYKKGDGPISFPKTSGENLPQSTSAPSAPSEGSSSSASTPSASAPSASGSSSGGNPDSQKRWCSSNQKRVLESMIKRIDGRISTTSDNNVKKKLRSTKSMINGILRNYHSNNMYITNMQLNSGDFPTLENAASLANSRLQEYYANYMQIG